MDMHATVTIAKPKHEVYEFWSRLEQLPVFMAHLDEVTIVGDGRSHWKASAPFGRTVEWDAVTTVDIPGEQLAWRSEDGASVPNTGSVKFTPAPGDRGTELQVNISYDLPAGRVGEAIARYFGEEPHQQLDDDLRRFKQVMETGEVVLSDGAPAGKLARNEFPQHAAQPLNATELASLKEGTFR